MIIFVLVFWLWFFISFYRINKNEKKIHFAFKLYEAKAIDILGFILGSCVVILSTLLAIILLLD
jgi:hypothetical protein